MTWEMVNSGGIEISSTIDVWHAGRVWDMTKIHSSSPGDSFDNSILLATADAGVWLIYESSGESKSLSVEWENTHVTCLATGPNGPHHIFAGCGNDGSKPGGFGGALYETDTSLPNSLIQPWLKIQLPTPDFGSIFDIAVLKNQRIIVLACWNGLWWSSIPSPGKAYDWKKADWYHTSILGDPAPCYSVTLGPEGTIIVGAYDEKDRHKRGIFVGRFIEIHDFFGSKTLTLYIYPTTIHDWDPVGYPDAKSAMLRVSVASCETQPKEVYALSTGPARLSTEWGDRKEGQVNMVLRSSDGGLNWYRCGLRIDPPPPFAEPESITDPRYGNDDSGGIIHNISVHPKDPSKVAFGVLRPFISRNNGKSWQRIGTWDPSDPEALQVHDDVHFIYFDPKFIGNIYIGTDGGLISTIDEGGKFNSLYNKHLPNLQFYGRNTGHFYGKMCVSYVFPNFIGGGTQDNGNISCEILGQQQKTTPWKKLTGGDGGQMVTIPLAHGDVVLYSFYGGNEDDRKPRHATWDTTKQMLKNGGLIPGIDRDGNPISLIPVRSGSGEHISDFLPFSVMETIVDPKLHRGRLLMFAVAANFFVPEKIIGSSEPIFGPFFGLFAESNGYDMHWEPILPSGPWMFGSGAVVIPSWNLPAIGSVSGNRIFFSVDWGKRASSIYNFRPGEGTMFDFREILSPTYGRVPVGGFVSHIAIEDEDTIAYATYILHGSVTAAFPQGQSYLLRTQDGGRTWNRLDCPGIPKAAPGADANPILRGIDIDYTTRPATLYLATDKRVYVSTDNERNTWNDFSAGLPIDPHCADLIFVDRRKTEGKKYLYLPTHGWSVWRVAL